MKTIALETFPHRTLQLFYFEDVKNVESIMQQLRSGQLEVAFMSPLLIVDELQILVAANRVLLSEQRGKLVTKNIHSELIFVLAGVQNISESLRKFGMNPKEDHFLVALFDASQEKVAELRRLVVGKEIEVENFKRRTDLEKAKKHYKVTPAELEFNGLLECIVTRIAVRGC